MSMLYKLRKLERTFSDGRQDPANGKWFARTVYVGTVTTDDLAQIIERNCSMKRSDVKAVLTELVEVMTSKLQDSYAVKLDGIGTFKIALRSTGAVEASEFSVSKNVTGSKVNFSPAYTVDSATGTRSRSLLSGMKVTETPKNEVA